MFQQKSGIPMQQLDALMNIDNVYGMDEIIGDPIHAIEPQETPQSQSTTSLLGMSGLVLLFVILFLIFAFRK